MKPFILKGYTESSGYLTFSSEREFCWTKWPI